MSNETEGPLAVPALSQMGGTFAERAKAAKKVSKAVDPDETQAVENKSVAAKKTSAKKKS